MHSSLKLEEPLELSSGFSLTIGDSIKTQWTAAKQFTVLGTGTADYIVDEQYGLVVNFW